jgi:uncharacterized protein
VGAAIARLALLSFVLVAFAAAARPVPELSRRVTDQAGALSLSTVARLEEKLAAYEQQTGHQLAVLVIPSLQGDVLESYSLQVAEAWRLGDQKRSDGALLLVSTGDRALRIEVGYGLEGAIPDHLAARVIDQHIVPRFKQGDVDGGVEAGVDALMKLASGENLGPAPSASGPPSMTDATFGVITVAMMSFFYFVTFPRRWRAVIFGVGGVVVGWMMYRTIQGALTMAVLGVLLGLLFPRVRRGGSGGWSSGSGGSRSSGSWSSSSSSSGGFRGGGGSFGGGGASGRW